MLSVWEKPFHTLSALGRRRSVWLAAPLLLYCWSVVAPFMLDDLHLVRTCERYLRGSRAHLGLFEFAPDEKTLHQLVDDGSIPWWAPSTLKITFFRPLAEWSFYADMRVFGAWPAGHRTVSLAWFALALILIHRMYVHVGGDASRAGVATLFFGISQTVTAPAVFVCNRSDLLVLVGAAIATESYWNAAERPLWKTLPIAALGYAMALLSKEVAVPLAAVVIAYEALSRRYRWREPNGMNRGAVTLLLALMTTVYVGFYMATMPTGGALLKNLGHLAMKMPVSLAMFLSVWTTACPLTFLTAYGKVWLIWIAAPIGAGIFAAALYYVLKGLRQDAGVRFFLIWITFFLALTLITVVEPRALCLSTVGWAYLLAALLQPRTDTVPPPPLALRHWLFVANVTMSGLFAVGTIAYGMHFEDAARARLRGYLAGTRNPMRGGHTLIVGEAARNDEIFCAGDRLALITNETECSVAYLTTEGTRATFTREDDHTIVVASDSPLLFGSELHKMAFGPAPTFKGGERFVRKDFTVEIAAVRDGSVRALRVRFTEPLSSERLHFYPPDLVKGVASRPQVAGGIRTLDRRISGL